MNEEKLKDMDLIQTQKSGDSSNESYAPSTDRTASSRKRPATNSTREPRALPAKRTFRQRSYLPMCNHDHMIRVHGDYTCFECGKLPELGWVYRCHQEQERQQQIVQKQIDLEAINWHETDTIASDKKAQIAALLPLSPAVVRSILANNYTVPQVQQLLLQRQNVIKTIEMTETFHHYSPTTPSVNAHTPESLIAHTSEVGSITNEAGGSDYLASKPSTSSNLTLVNSLHSPNCRYQVCHRCSPKFQERIYVSLNAVAEGKVAPILEEEWNYSRVLDANKYMRMIWDKKMTIRLV